MNLKNIVGEKKQVMEHTVWFHFYKVQNWQK